MAQNLDYENVQHEHNDHYNYLQEDKLEFIEQIAIIKSTKNRS